MNKQYGLVNEDNPCRCSKKAKAMEAAGKMQTNKKLFDPVFSETIAVYSEKGADETDLKYIQFFRQHPIKKQFDKATVINELINDKNYNKYFDDINKL